MLWNNVFDCGDTTAELGQGDFPDDIDCGSPATGDFVVDDLDRRDITTEPGHGDFAGDHVVRGDPTRHPGEEPPGQQDDFMATGVTWWARSRTTGQWRYLNTMKERLPELQLGKFDDDDIWDVAPRTRRPEIPPEKYSKSGTSPWRSRSVIHP